MSRKPTIPSGPTEEQLKKWLAVRSVFINIYPIANWYPNFCLTARIDLTAADRLRKKMNQEDPDPAHRVTFNHMINKAVANAIRNHIVFNGHYTNRDSVSIPRRINTSFVVDLNGFATTVENRDPDRKTIREIAEETNRIVNARRVIGLGDGREAKVPFIANLLLWLLPYYLRVRRDLSHKAALDLLSALDGTVVTTNPGTLGVQDCKAMLFFGLRMTCLRIMTIEEEATLEDGQVRFRKVLPVGLDYDQRMVDAGPAARFLAEIKRNMEQPEEYLIGPAVVDESAPFAWPRGA